MPNKIVLIGAVAFLAYAVGARASRAQVKSRESVGHQIVRLWNEPKAKKSRKKAAEKAARAAEKRRKALSKRTQKALKRAR